MKSRGQVIAQTQFKFEICGKERVKIKSSFGENIDVIYKRDSGEDQKQNITIAEISKYFEVQDSSSKINVRCFIEKYELV